jgi:hypothetical protein
MEHGEHRTDMAKQENSEQKQQQGGSWIDAVDVDTVDLAATGARCAIDALTPAHKTGGGLGHDRFATGGLDKGPHIFNTGCEQTTEGFVTASTDAIPEAAGSVLEALGEVVGGLLDGVSF